MKQTLLILAIFFVFAANASAQSESKTVNIHGVLTDSTTLEPIQFVNVVFLQNNKRVEYCMTNQDGEFQCTLPKGKYKIELTAVGYSRKLLEIDALGNTNLDTIPISECKNCSIITFSIDTTSK